MKAETPESHDRGRKCACVTDHNPEPSDGEEHHIWPKGQGGPDTAANFVFLCLLPGSLVLRSDGMWQPIEHVRTGDVVIGGDGAPDLVTGTRTSYHSGDVIECGPLTMTPNHLVATRRGWVPAARLRKHEETLFLKPAGQGMEPHVLSLIDAQEEVADPVVVRHQIDVMDDFGCRQGPSDCLLHDPTCPLYGTTLVPLPDDLYPVPLAVAAAVPLPLGGSRNPVERSHAAGVGAVGMSGAGTTAVAGANASELSSALLAVSESPRSLPHSGRTGVATRLVRVPKLFRGAEGHVASVALPLFHGDVLPVHAWWSAFEHLGASSYSGPVYDITISRSRSFVAHGIVVHNCPTTHTNAHNLERAWWKAGGVPAWEIRRQYNYFTRELARRAYQSAMAQELVP